MVIKTVLYSLCTAIEAAALRFGSFSLDGSDDLRRVKIGKQPADRPAQTSLSVGIDYESALDDPFLQDQALLSAPIIKSSNSSTGVVEIVPAAVNTSRLAMVHLHLRQPEDEGLRIGAEDIHEAYMRCETRLMQALGLNERTWAATVHGVQRGFVTRYEGQPFISEQGVTIHAVFGFRLTYPLIDEEVTDVVEEYLATRIDLAIGQPGDLPAIGVDPIASSLGQLVVIE